MYIYVTFRDIFIETFILKELKDARNFDGLFLVLTVKQFIMSYSSFYCTE